AGVLQSDLVEATVSWWLASRSVGLSAWRSELVFEAQSLVIGMLTGHRMDGAAAAVVLDTARVAAGSSPVGFVRQTLVTKLPELARRVGRGHPAPVPQIPATGSHLVGAGQSHADPG